MACRSCLVVRCAADVLIVLLLFCHSEHALLASATGLTGVSHSPCPLCIEERSLQAPRSLQNFLATSAMANWRWCSRSSVNICTVSFDAFSAAAAARVFGTCKVSAECATLYLLCGRTFMNAMQVGCSPCSIARPAAQAHPANVTRVNVSHRRSRGAPVALRAAVAEPPAEQGGGGTGAHVAFLVLEELSLQLHM